MAVRKNGEGRSWIIKVESNPDYCGVGAGGTQFANGKAVTPRREWRIGSGNTKDMWWNR